MNNKTYVIDMDSLEDVGKMINILKSKYSELRKIADPGFITKNERTRKIFNACMDIMGVDISDVYAGQILDPDPKYYVYAHCDPGFKIALQKEGKTTFAASLGCVYVPFYIGKGTANRAYELDRNEAHRKVRQKIRKFDKEVDVRILRDGLTELEALCIESKLIDIFGLIAQRNGHLVNLDEGSNVSARREKYKEKLFEISDLYKNSV